MDPVKLFTIGHSTRTLEEFIALLKREGVTHLADVRAFPASRRYPHFAGENLKESLAEAGIQYSHRPSLGGRRKPRRDSHNIQWRNSSFRAYADYMETREFAHALEGLLETARGSPTVIMCAEAVPWRCHRSLISDSALAAGGQVLHIMDAKTEPHRLTSFARIDHQHHVRYDGGVQNELFETNAS